MGLCRRRLAPAISEGDVSQPERRLGRADARAALTCRARTAEIGRHAAITQRAGASESTGMSLRPRVGEWDGPAEALPAQPRQTDSTPPTRHGRYPGKHVSDPARLCGGGPNRHVRCPAGRVAARQVAVSAAMLERTCMLHGEHRVAVTVSCNSKDRG